MTENNSDRRTEQRLRYHWPIWFAENFNDTLSNGQMVDISSSGAAFTYNSFENCPYPGQQLTARFSIPKFGSEDSFNMDNYARNATVCRVDCINDSIRKVAIQFTQPLPFKPGQQGKDEFDTRERLKAVTI